VFDYHAGIARSSSGDSSPGVKDAMNFSSRRDG
jgi:hypothetical protein